MRRLRHSYGGLTTKNGFSKEGPPPLTAQEARNLRGKIRAGDHNPITQGRRLCFQTYPASATEPTETADSADACRRGEYSIVDFTVPKMEDPKDTAPHEQVVRQMQEHPLYVRSIAIVAVGVEAFPTAWPPFLQVLDWKWSNAAGRSKEEEGEETAVFHTSPLPPCVRCVVLRHCPNLRERFLRSGAGLALEDCPALETLDMSHSGLERLPDVLPPCLRTLEVGFCHLVALDLGALPPSLELADVSYNFVNAFQRNLPGPEEGMAVANTTVNMEGNRAQIDLDMGVPQKETVVRTASWSPSKEVSTSSPSSFSEAIRRPRNSDVAMLRRFFYSSVDDQATKQQQVLGACFEATVLRAVVYVHIGCARKLKEMRSTFRAYRRSEAEIPAVDDVQAIVDSLGLHRIARKRGVSVRDPPTGVWGAFKKALLSAARA